MSSKLFVMMFRKRCVKAFHVLSYLPASSSYQERQATGPSRDEAKKEGVGADITITNGLSLKINGEYGTWDLYGFPKNTTVYIINSHDPTEIYKADK
jgi:hypothetical protein